MTRIAIGIPAFAERQWLPRTLDSLCRQDTLDFQVWICVNQPAEHLEDPERAETTGNNLETLAWLAAHRRRFPFPIHIMDAVHPPHAPSAKRAGVGWARRYLFEHITANLPDDGLCISLDADTRLEHRYLTRVARAFRDYPNAVALAAPYYHPVPENPARAFPLLRYEIFLRYYQLNLWRIGSPYAFLALGSALSFRAGAWRRSGGFPPRRAGEDFYFLQQLRKIGPVIRWIESPVYPSARVSRRNPFGTGPLMGGGGHSPLELRYPFYRPELFDMLGQTFGCFAELYRGRRRLPIDAFLRQRLKGYTAFDRMRRNFGRPDLFVKACHERLDGLRTLQCLRFYHQHRGSPTRAEESIQDLLERLGKPSFPVTFDLEQLKTLASLRDRLYEYEAEFQRNFMRAWDPRARW